MAEGGGGGDKRISREEREPGRNVQRGRKRYQQKRGAEGSAAQGSLGIYWQMTQDSSFFP